MKTHSRVSRGFTIVELILTISVIGVVIALVVTKVGPTKHAAYEAAMKNTLARIAEAQALYRSKYGEYGGPADLSAEFNFCTDEDVSIRIMRGNAGFASFRDGYRALAFHDKTNAGCILEAGQLSPGSPKFSNQVRCAPDGPPAPTAGAPNLTTGLKYCQ